MDIFRPKRDPALTLYDAFEAEAKHREGRTPAEWMDLEQRAVWTAARDYAQQHELRVPTLAEVRAAESMACGHVDYGAKWAHGVAQFMRAHQ